MDKKLLIEELTRIHQIMNNDKGIIIMESNLLTEAGIPIGNMVKGIERLFDRKAVSAAEKYLEQGTEKFAVKLKKYITDKLLTPQGIKDLRGFIKDVSKESPLFADKFAKKNKKLFDDIALAQGAEKADRIIKYNFGDDVLSAYRQSSSPRPNPPVPKPLPKPVELRNVSDFKQWIKDNVKSDINITPIYDKSTKDLWTIHGEKYLESIKPPSLLNNSDKIKKFQDWLDKNHPDWIDVPLNKSESKGYGNYGSKTRKAYETYGKEYYSGLSLVERMGGVEYDALSPKTLAWWERIISTDKTFSDKIQGVFDRWVQSYLVKHQGEEKYINDLFAQFKQSFDDTYFKLKQGEQADLTMLRNLNQRISKISKTNEADLESLYTALEHTLKEKLPKDSDKVAELMKSIKSQNPFQMGSFIGEGRMGWMTQYINGTASGKLMENFLKLFTLNKEQFQKNFSEMIQRIGSLLLYGSPKSGKEIGEYLEKETVITFKDWPRIDKVIWNNINNGTLYAGLWGATNIAMPLFIASAKSMWYFINLFGAGNTEERLGWWDEFSTEIAKQYESHPTWQYIIPIHSYGYDLIQKWLNLSDDAFANKYKDMVTRETIKELQKLYRDGKLSASMYVTSLRGIIPNDDEINSINNSENGFKVFCKLTNLTFQKWDNVNKVGKTNDGQVWTYNESVKCFINSEEAKKIQNVEDKTDVVIEKVENTPLGFEVFVKSKGLTILTPYDEISGQTNEPDPNGAKTNNWYFNTNTNTFESY